MTVALALLAGFLFAAAAVLQQHVAEGHGASFSLIRQPLWLAGVACDVSGFGFQALALHLGAVVEVQALLTTTLPFGLLLSRARPGAGGWLGTGLLALGLAGMLLATDPQGAQRAGGGSRLLLACAIIAALAIGTAVARAATVQALGAGLLFALMAVLVQAVADQLADGGLVEAITNYQGYLLAVAAVAGLSVQQRAYAAGPLGPTLTVLTLIDPVASLGLGVYVAGDRLRGGPYAAAAVVAALLAAVGVVLVARARDHAEPQVLAPSGRA